jgi:hypothetical protein
MGTEDDSGSNASVCLPVRLWAGLSALDLTRFSPLARRRRLAEWDFRFWDRTLLRDCDYHYPV